VPFRVRAVVVIHTLTQRERETLLSSYYIICLRATVWTDSLAKKKKTNISTTATIRLPHFRHFFRRRSVSLFLCIIEASSFLALKRAHVKTKIHICTHKKKQKYKLKRARFGEKTLAPPDRKSFEARITAKYFGNSLGLKQRAAKLSSFSSSPFWDFATRI